MTKEEWIADLESFISENVPDVRYGLNPDEATEIVTYLKEEANAGT